MANVELLNNILSINQIKVMEQVAASIDRVTDEAGNGIFLHVEPDNARLGMLVGVERFVACYQRPNHGPMAVRQSHNLAELDPKTQFLLCRTADSYILVVPLLGHELNIDDAGFLLLNVSTSGSTPALYLSAGPDAYRLLEEAAVSIVRTLKTLHLRKDKRIPALLDKLGWCTWGGMGRELSQAGIANEIRDLKSKGFTPGFVVLDCGWQDTGGKALHLRSFDTGTGFPDGLGGFVKMLKSDLGVKELLLWHTVNGFWTGLDPKSFPEYADGELITYVDKECGEVGARLIPPEKLSCFFRRYHTYMKKRGVDGVKIAVLDEGMPPETGLAALHGSVADIFLGESINCMASLSHAVFNSRSANLFRSTNTNTLNHPVDAQPNLLANAIISAWLGEFAFTDWDMFCSGAVGGALQGAVRAISGGPVYISDKPGKANAKVLAKLTLQDGSVLRSTRPARPTLDCLFAEPGEEGLLKLFNTNTYGSVLGIFHVDFHEREGERTIISGNISPADVDVAPARRFAVYAHNSGNFHLCNREDKIPVWLGEMSFEIFTIMPVTGNIAPIGLVDKYNSSAAIAGIERFDKLRVQIHMRDGGRFACWCEYEPAELTSTLQHVPFQYNGVSGLLTCDIDHKGPLTLQFIFRKRDVIQPV